MLIGKDGQGFAGDGGSDFDPERGGLRRGFGRAQRRSRRSSSCGELLVRGIRSGGDGRFGSERALVSERGLRKSGSFSAGGGCREFRSARIRG